MEAAHFAGLLQAADGGAVTLAPGVTGGRLPALQ